MKSILALILEHVSALCTINSAAMSVLPRPGTISRPERVPYSKSLPMMKTRLRYISFFGIGIDSRYLGIVCILGPASVCHIIRILPNATRVSNILQEHIIVSSFWYKFLGKIWSKFFGCIFTNILVTISKGLRSKADYWQECRRHW